MNKADFNYDVTFDAGAAAAPEAAAAATIVTISEDERCKLPPGVNVDAHEVMVAEPLSSMEQGTNIQDPSPYIQCKEKLFGSADACVDSTCSACLVCIPSEEDCEGFGEGFGACCAFIFFVSAGFVVFIMPFLLPYWVENSKSCDEFVPDGGIGSTAGAAVLQTYVSKSNIENGLSLNKDKFKMTASLFDENGSPKGKVEIDKDTFTCNLCNNAGTCILMPDNYRLNQRDFEKGSNHEFPFIIKVTSNITIDGVITMPNIRRYYAKFYEPEVALTLGTTTVIFQNSDSRKYKRRLNFARGYNVGNSAQMHWPGMSTHIPLADPLDRDSRYCIPSLPGVNTSSILNQASPDEFQVIEAVLQGETLSQLQFIVRQAMFISEHGRLPSAAINAWIWFILFAILFLCNACVSAD
uniref:Uncharacterized protein n=1 Tax=Aplanochytrium stocchinoi TaxID=215587 RepID=A0A7S3LK49_9STRA|mmetsp:Transcript_15672/g.20111  ORF Transcript_15672/g.20111 Transcript_15672/m.20111 type:complete len:410 (+) Transcript_15672:593-1822(+)